MVKNKNQIREDFENNIKNSFSELSNMQGGQRMQQTDGFTRASIKQILILFILKSLVVLSLGYIFIVITISSIGDTLTSVIVDKAITQRVAVHDWVAMSVKGKGIVYVLIESKNDPNLSLSLAKYYKRIGDSESALELTNLTQELIQNNKISENERQERIESIRNDILGKPAS